MIDFALALSLGLNVYLFILYRRERRMFSLLSKDIHRAFKVAKRNLAMCKEQAS